MSLMAAALPRTRALYHRCSKPRASKYKGQPLKQAGTNSKDTTACSTAPRHIKQQTGRRQASIPNGIQMTLPFLFIQVVAYKLFDFVPVLWTSADAAAAAAQHHPTQLSKQPSDSLPTQSNTHQVETLNPGFDTPAPPDILTCDSTMGFDFPSPQQQTICTLERDMEIQTVGDSNIKQAATL